MQTITIHPSDFSSDGTIGNQVNGSGQQQAITCNKLQAHKSSYQAWKCVSFGCSLLAIVLLLSKWYEVTTDLQLLLGINRILSIEQQQQQQQSTFNSNATIGEQLLANDNNNNNSLASAGNGGQLTWPPVPLERLLPTINESTSSFGMDSLDNNDSMLMSHMHMSLNRELNGNQLLKQEVEMFIAEFRSAKLTLSLSSILLIVYLISWILMTLAINDTRISNDISLRNILILSIFGGIDITASLGFVMLRVIMYSNINSLFAKDILGSAGLKDSPVRLSSDQLTAFTALRLISMRSCSAYVDVYVSIVVLLLTILRLYAILRAITYYRRLRRLNDMSHYYNNPYHVDDVNRNFFDRFAIAEQPLWRQIPPINQLNQGNNSGGGGGGGLAKRRGADASGTVRHYQFNNVASDRNRRGSLSATKPPHHQRAQMFHQLSYNNDHSSNNYATHKHLSRMDKGADVVDFVVPTIYTIEQANKNHNQPTTSINVQHKKIRQQIPTILTNPSGMAMGTGMEMATGTGTATSRPASENQNQHKARMGASGKNGSQQQSGEPASAQMIGGRKVTTLRKIGPSVYIWPADNNTNFLATTLRSEKVLKSKSNHNSIEQQQQQQKYSQSLQKRSQQQEVSPSNYKSYSLATAHSSGLVAGKAIINLDKIPPSGLIQKKQHQRRPAEMLLAINTKHLTTNTTHDNNNNNKTKVKEIDALSTIIPIKAASSSSSGPISGTSTTSNNSCSTLLSQDNNNNNNIIEINHHLIRSCDSESSGTIGGRQADNLQNLFTLANESSEQNLLTSEDSLEAPEASCSSAATNFNSNNKKKQVQHESNRTKQQQQQLACNTIKSNGKTYAVLTQSQLDKLGKKLLKEKNKSKQQHSATHSALSLSRNVAKYKLLARSKKTKSFDNITSNNSDLSVFKGDSFTSSQRNDSGLAGVIDEEDQEEDITFDNYLSSSTSSCSSTPSTYDNTTNERDELVNVYNGNIINNELLQIRQIANDSFSDNEGDKEFHLIRSKGKIESKGRREEKQPSESNNNQNQNLYLERCK